MTAASIWSGSPAVTPLLIEGDIHYFLTSKSTNRRIGDIEGLRIDQPHSGGVGEIAVDWVRLTN